MYDDRPDLNHPHEMPLATAAELRAYRVRVPNVDLTIQPSDAWIVLPWKSVFRQATAFMKDLGCDSAEIETQILTHLPLTTEADRQAYRRAVRPRLYDLARIQLSLHVLYRTRFADQRAWFDAAHPLLDGRSPREVLLNEGPARVRRLLAQRLEAL